MANPSYERPTIDRPQIDGATRPLETYSIASLPLVPPNGYHAPESEKLHFDKRWVILGLVSIAALMLWYVSQLNASGGTIENQPIRVAVTESPSPTSSSM